MVGYGTVGYVMDFKVLDMFNIDTVDGSEIPRPTTVWMVLKPCKYMGFQLPFLQLLSLPDFSHQPYLLRKLNWLKQSSSNTYRFGPV